MSILNRVSESLYQYASGKLLFFSAALFAFYIGVIMPGAADVPRIAGSGDGLLGLFAYSASDFYTQIAMMSNAERQLFVSYRLVNDMGWIAAMAAFFGIGLSYLLKLLLSAQHALRPLNLVGLLPSLLDLSENLLQIVLVQMFPEEYLVLAQICSALTAFKWVVLNICLLLILLLPIAALLRRFATNK